MTDEQKETLTRCLGSILKFYAYGKQGAVMEPGGFVELFKLRCPDLYKGNEEFIEMIDNLVMASYRAGRNAAPPSQNKTTIPLPTMPALKKSWFPPASRGCRR